MFDNIINMFKKTWKYLLVALVVVALLRYKFGAEFFDIFGVLIFGGLVFIGLFELYRKKPMPDWVAFSLIVIGLMGLVIDVWTVIIMIKSLIIGV